MKKIFFLLFSIAAVHANPEELRTIRTAFEEGLSQEENNTASVYSVCWKAYTQFLNSCSIPEVQNFIKNPWSIVEPRIKKIYDAHTSLTSEDLQEVGAFYAQRYPEHFMHSGIQSIFVICFQNIGF